MHTDSTIFPRWVGMQRRCSCCNVSYVLSHQHIVSGHPMQGLGAVCAAFACVTQPIHCDCCSARLSIDSSHPKQGCCQTAVRRYRSRYFVRGEHDRVPCIV